MTTPAEAATGWTGDRAWGSDEMMKFQAQQDELQDQIEQLGPERHEADAWLSRHQTS